MKKKQSKKLKKSQLRNMARCERCGGLFPKTKLNKVEVLMPPDYDEETIVKLCVDCDESWMDE